MRVILNSNGPEITGEIGIALGRLLKDCPATVLMSGDLGAGKTTLSQAIVAGYGLPDLVTSPTYTLMNIYGDNEFYHYDLYRLEDTSELFEIGFEEALGEGVPLIIEWPEMVTDVAFNCRLDIAVAYGEEADQRIITMETHDDKLGEGLEHFGE